MNRLHQEGGLQHYISGQAVCETGFVSLQVNARKVYDEANVLAGILSNQLFLAILLGEASLQVRYQYTAVLCADRWEAGTAF